MIELENIKLQTTWNDAAQSINSNFAKIIVELAKGGQGGSMPSEYLSDAEAVNHILTITKSDGTTVHFTDTTYDLSPYALSSDLSGYLPLTGGDLIGNLTINSQQVIHSGNISSQSVASAVKLTDNTSYTAWGQTFFENGKPKNVNGDITLDNNKKVYVKDTGGDVVGGLWMDTNNYVRIGQGGYNTYIQGYNILLNSQYGEVVSIRHNGNVGIKNSSPAYDLDVTGTIHASGDVIAQGAISAQGSNAYADELSEGGLDTSQMWYELGLNDSSKVIHESHIPTLPASKISGLPSELPNPYALTINGQTYDGSAPVTVNVQGGATYSVATTTTDGLLSKNRVTAVERLQTLLSNYWVVREVTAGSVTRTGTDMTIPLSVTSFDMSTTSGSNPSRWVLPIASQSAAGLMSASDKTKLDGMGTDDTDTGGEWYNIHIDKDETSGDSSRILYTVIEDYIPAVKRDENGIPLPDDQRLSILKDNADYRLVLLKWRKRHKRGRGWAMPMFAYERFHTRYDDWENSGSVGVEPEIICDIAENNTWWPVKGVKTRWFAQTNSTYPVALASAMNKTYSANDGKYSLWKNTRNKKLCFGVALYKKTGEGTIGWQRVSNIAYVELFLTKYGTYLTNIRN